MKKPLKQLLVGLSVATAVAAGTVAVADNAVAVKMDTGWGAPATTDDTGWGAPAPTPTPTTPVTTDDTGWG